MDEHSRDEILAQVREDVAYIRAKIEAIPDHEQRIRSLERWRWGIPGGLLAAFLTFIQ